MAGISTANTNSLDGEILARSESVKRYAVQLGFDACAFARAELSDSNNLFLEWLDAGYHADMKWMGHTANIRLDPRSKLPGAKSVIVLARNYYKERPPASPDSGKVSRYAWGRDYHRVLRKPLYSLARHVEKLEEGVQTYCSIDSGPVLEKFWAARAGLGWIGKNSLVLRQDIGSWFFIGVIYTTLDLSPDSPTPNFCGSCRACLEACPTGAIVDPAKVDSRRCISYHTIENKNEIHSEIASKMKDWVFGCDICQEVCPWNRHTQETSESDFAPRPGHANPKLNALIHMNAEVFQKTFSGSPIMRAKHVGMSRNARIAFNNTQDPI